ncbi:hypothetical protein BEP19_09715 [Ammoniphilus oxalaticus]|uniref:MFS transporter n=1 Tax=Ammoniphilus oxalaticus TaxID=66863 RepID=A0A419SKV9_9BACL|nr:MFS transporter [Ammoniphilus oxalaticus]RKD24641.1 hypothetical protein BEP19_09715 [Ammoniphilus oxalaticus]
MDPKKSSSPAITALFLVQLVFSIIFAFANLFMNIYLWSRGKSFWQIGVFNLFSVQAIFFSSLCGAYALKRWGTRSTFLLSSLLALGLFGYLFVFNVAKPSLIPTLGLLYGGYIGLFYIGFNLQILWLSNDKNRSLLVGLESAFATLAQLLTPLLAGYFIAARGYRDSFMLIIGLLILQLLISSRVPRIRATGGYRKRYFFLAENETMARLGFSSAAYGFLAAFIQMSYGLFFYFLVQNEWRLGIWNFVFGGVSATMFWLVGKQLKQTNREILLSMGMLMATIVTLSLLLPVPQLFILFNLVISVSLPMIWVPAKSSHYTQMIEIANQSNKQQTSRLGKMMQLLVFREFSISLGRIVFFMLIVIGFDFGLSVSYYAMILLACLMPFTIRLFAAEKIK